MMRASKKRRRKMNRNMMFLILFTLGSIHLALGQSSCGQFDYSQWSAADYKSGAQGHITGYHAASLQGDTICYYTGRPAENCTVQMEARGDLLSDDYEAGYIYTWEHVPALGYFDGGANGPSPQSATEVTAFGVDSCLLPCGFSVSVSFPTANVSYSAKPIFAFQQQESFTCAQKTGAQCQPQQCPPRYEWNAAECACVYVGGSPIIIDTRNVGFNLSKPEKGTCAPFDLRGDGEKECWSWPVVGSGNGWLVYPHRTNPKVLVASGKDLFGNYTDMLVNTTEKEKNGYEALMAFAQPQNGGYMNPDGTPNYILDDRDKVWDKLRIWIPKDYSGVAKPNELHKLSEVGIHSIALIPAYYKKVDEYGNSFRWGAPLNIKASEARDWANKNDSRLSTVTPHELDVRSYDVWLVNSEVGK
jgi:hypothetical protein